MVRTRSRLFSGTAFPSPAIVHMIGFDNTLTAIIPDIYVALDTVSRELVGFIPSAGRAFGAERAALNQSVKYSIAPTLQSVNIVPAMTIPEPPDFTMETGTLTISKSKSVKFGFTGEEQRGLNSGVGYLSAQAQLIAQAMRTLVNEAESDLASAAYLAASRAYGTAGTTPFATGTGDTAQVRKILDDNGAPLTGRSLVVNTSAGASIRTNSNFNKVNESGTQMTLRDGELMNVHGFSIKESAQVVNHTRGTAAGATTNAVGYAVGARTITLASAGTGTIKAGDVVSFAGDTNKYVVAVGDTDVSNGGTITLAAPGLLAAIPAAATAITVAANYAANVAFSQDALHIVMRPPALPDEGDAAIESMMITDPRSGMTFEMRVYAVYRKITIDLGLAWGVKASKSQHIALLLG